MTTTTTYCVARLDQCDDLEVSRRGAGAGAKAGAPEPSGAHRGRRARARAALAIAQHANLDRVRPAYQ